MQLILSCCKSTSMLCVDWPNISSKTSRGDRHCQLNVEQIFSARTTTFEQKYGRPDSVNETQCTETISWIKSNTYMTHPV